MTRDCGFADAYQGGARFWTGTSNCFLDANRFRFITLGFFTKKRYGRVLNFLRLNCLELWGKGYEAVKGTLILVYSNE